MNSWSSCWGRGGGGTWNGYGGDGLRLAQSVHLHVLEGFCGSRLQVPGTEQQQSIKALPAPGGPKQVRDSRNEDSLLPLLVSSPELVDYKGQTVREAHGGHTGEDEDKDRGQTGRFEEVRDREGQRDREGDK